MRPLCGDQLFAHGPIERLGEGAFEPVEQLTDFGLGDDERRAERDAVAEGHEIQVVIRWGDPILADAPEFNPRAQTPEKQARQFGYNNDYLDFFPLPKGNSYK